MELPSRLPAEALDNPAMAPTLVLSAIADFECALANYIPATGMLTDELIGSTGWIAPTMWDQRRIFPDNGNLGEEGCTDLGWGVFRPLSTAYFTARDAGRRLSALSDEQVADRTALLGQAAAYGAYTLTLLGESFCEVAVELGPLMTPAETLQRAEQEFTSALELAQQAGDEETANMALVGRARVRLDLGKMAEAAADARLIPEGFLKVATRSGSSERRWNRVSVDFHENFYISVDPRFRDLDVDGVPDSRVVVNDAGRNGHDGVTHSFLAMKYESNADPLPIASWDEAQLIIAEAEGGQSAVDAINRLRIQAGLPLFSSADPAAIAAQVQEERRRELYLEGHRLNDFLRHGLAWDQGTTHKGVPFGPT
ncbi:MAG: RagB/SusD family nutrient uptake outer membrane protein, partial [Planctomycetaceae bacterium]